MALAISLLLLLIPLALLGHSAWYITYVLFAGLVPLSWIGSLNTPVGQLSVAAINLLSILLSSLLGILIASGGGGVLLTRLWPFLLFLLFCLISIAWSPDLSMGLRMLLKIGAPLAFAFYLAVNLPAIGHARALRTLLWSGILSILVASTAFALGYKSGSGALGLPASSSAVFSAHLLVVFCVALAHALVSREWRYALLAMLVAVAILGAFTRITIAAVFVAAAAMLFIRLRGLAKVIAPLFAMLLLLVLFFSVDLFKERMFTHRAASVSFGLMMEKPEFVLDSVAGSGRFSAWSFALEQLFLPSPLLGSGLGAAQALFYGGGNREQPSVVHSEYIRILCDLGAVGLALYLSGWLLVYYHLYLTRYRHPVSRISVLAAAAAGVGYLAFLATDNGLDYAAQCGNFVFALLALAFTAPPRKKFPARRPGSRIRDVAQPSPAWDP